ncbi:MAG: nitroreductase family protein [Spirochaetales bacterium]|jgi:nitroreductase|nr:nitroreductase family protein [Spirochaetales bacterium]
MFVYDGGNMDLLPEIVNRVTVRHFEERGIDPACLDRILEAGRIAPSAKNRQPWRFIIVQDERKRKMFEQASFGQEHVGQAPAIIACCSTNIEYRMPNGQLSYPIDISFAATQMMFQAVHEGLGTCVVTTFDEAALQEILTVPYSMRVVMLLLLGYAAHTEPSFRERLALERIISYEHW